MEVGPRPGRDALADEPSLPEGLGHIGPDTILAGDQIVIAGGQVNASGEVEIKTVLDYDPATGVTTQLTDLPEGRKSAFCGYADGELIVSCGNQSNSPYLSQDTWVAAFDPDAVSTPTPTATGTITGTVFDDVDDSGTLTAGDVGLAGQAVYLDGDGTDSAGDLTATTDANGAYAIADVPAGTYALRQVVPDGHTQTLPTGGAYTVTIAAGATVASRNFGDAFTHTPTPTPTPTPAPTDPTGPDLTGAIKLKLRRNAVAGDAGVAVVTVRNVGPGTADGTIAIAVDVSANGATSLGFAGLRSAAAIRLKPGRAMAFSIPITLPATLPGGSYQLLATVDSGNAITEADEANNTAASAAVAVLARTVAVTATATVSPIIVRPGRRPPVVRVDVTNAGTVATTGPVTLTLSVIAGDGTVTTGILTVTRPGGIAVGKRRSFKIPFGLSAASSLSNTLSVQVAVPGATAVTATAPFAVLV